MITIITAIIMIAFELSETLMIFFRVIDNWPQFDGKPRAHEVLRNEQNIAGAKHVEAGSQANVSKSAGWELFFFEFFPPR